MSRRWTALVALAVLAGCNPRAPEAPPSASPNPNATPTGIALKISASGNATQPVLYVLQKGNRKYYQLLTKSLQTIGAPGSEHLTFDHPVFTFFAKDGSRLHAFSPRGSADRTQDRVMLEGGVHAYNDAGMTLSCDTLTYDRATETIHGVGHVVIANKNGFRGTGNRFDSDVSLTHTTMQ
jgi:LPS export ABC transporter protein LptC